MIQDLRSFIFISINIYRRIVLDLQISTFSFLFFFDKGACILDRIYDPFLALFENYFCFCHLKKRKSFFFFFLRAHELCQNVTALIRFRKWYYYINIVIITTIIGYTFLISDCAVWYNVMHATPPYRFHGTPLQVITTVIFIYIYIQTYTFSQTL